MDLETLRWPADAERLDWLREQGVARFVVVAAGASPPEAPDCLEEWVAEGAGATEVAARRAALLRRAARHGGPPSIDGDGLLWHRDAWVSLSPVEQSLAGALVERFGAVVPRDALARHAWPGGLPTRNALDVHVLRLRRRIAPLGLEIRTVRSRGYLLQPADGDGRAGRGTAVAARANGADPA